MNSRENDCIVQYYVAGCFVLSALTHCLLFPRLRLKKELAFVCCSVSKGKTFYHVLKNSYILWLRVCAAACVCVNISYGLGTDYIHNSNHVCIVFRQD